MLRLPFAATATAAPQGRIAGFLQRPDTAGAAAAIERALAATAPEVPAQTAILDALAAHRVAGNESRQLRIGLWLRALKACVADDSITDEELRYLNKLRLVLGLRERDVDPLWYDTRHGIYREVLNDALADGTLSEDEWRQLDVVASGLRLAKEERDRISSEPIASAIARVVNEVISDRRVSPAEQRQLEQLAGSLGVSLDSLADDPKQLLDRFSLLWRIENEELPVISTGINLQRGEVCHCAFPARWYELRTRTVRSYRSGPVASVRIMKGLSYRVGAYQTQRVTADELTLIDAGIGYITNKRFIFDGQRKNTTIPYSAVLSITPFTDGLEIEKATGKSPTLQVDGDAEVVTAIFAEALSRS